MHSVKLAQFDSRDSVAIRIEGNQGQPGFVLASFYMAHEDDLPPPVLVELAEFCRVGGLGLLVGCDANAHHTSWGSKDNNPRGYELLDFIAAANLQWCNVGNKPTFRVANRSEVLDLTLANQAMVDRVGGWHVSDNPSLSDHAYMRFTVSHDVGRGKLVKPMGRTDWALFNRALSARVPPADAVLDSQEDIDSAAEGITDAILSAHDIACPPRWVSSRCKSSPWWNSGLDNLRKQTRQKLRIARNSDTVETWESYRESQRLYKSEIKSAKAKSWKQYCEGLESLHPVARLFRFLRQDGRPGPQNMQKADGTTTSRPEDTLELMLASHLAIPTGLHAQVYSHLPWEDASQIITPQVLSASVSTFEPLKAPGADGIKPILLQKGWKHILPAFHNLCVACLRLGTIPRSWGKARGVLLPKLGRVDLTSPKAYRLITLSTFFLKVVEKVILWRLTSVKSVQRAITWKQHGFTAGSSTESALHGLVSRLEEALVVGNYSLAIFLDIQGAFDNVSFDAISESLREAEVDWGIARWINYMLRNRSTEVEWAGAKKTVRMSKGTSQGGVLSPLTWNTTIGGLLRLLDDSPAYVQAYADDIVILLQGPDLAVLHAQASDCLTKLDSWSRERNLSFSAVKSECVVFTWRRKWVLPPLLLGGNLIQRATTVKYLGVTLDHKLSWNAHVTRRTAQATNVLCRVRRTLGSTWGLAPKLTLWAYRALVLPLLEYGSVVWVGAVRKFWIASALSKVQRLACTMITSAFPGTPTCSLEALLNLPPLPVFLRGRALIAQRRLDLSGRWRHFSQDGKHSLCSHVRAIGKVMDAIPDAMAPLDRIVAATCPIPPCLISMEERAVAAEKASTLALSSFSCFTDGSKQDDGLSGSGYVVFHQGNELCKKSISLGRSASVFQAEIIAINAVVEDLFTRDLANSTIDIYSDSQAAIQAIGGLRVTASTVMTCRDAISQLVSCSNVVTIHWVPGHFDVMGNERADLLAREGSNRPPYGPEPLVPIPYSSLKRIVGAWIRTEHNKVWSGGTVGLSTKAVLPATDANLTKTLLTLSRKDLRVVVHSLTQHNSLRYHLHRIGQAEDP
ncbi:MAG: reverse transcriptase domain-containing protein, partial [Cyanobacteria bacterium J06553_1]